MTALRTGDDLRCGSRALPREARCRPRTRSSTQLPEAAHPSHSLTRGRLHLPDRSTRLTDASACAWRAAWTTALFIGRNQRRSLASCTSSGARTSPSPTTASWAIYPWTRPQAVGHQPAVRIGPVGGPGRRRPGGARVRAPAVGLSAAARGHRPVPRAPSADNGYCPQLNWAFSPPCCRTIHGAGVWDRQRPRPTGVRRSSDATVRARALSRPRRDAAGHSTQQ